MKKVGLFVLFIASVGLFCIHMNENVYAAEPANSQVGITFIEGDPDEFIDDGQGPGKDVPLLPDTSNQNQPGPISPEPVDHASHNLPQTGEKKRNRFIIKSIGFLSVLVVSILMHNLKKRKEEKQMKKSKLVLAGVAASCLFSASITASAAVDQNEVIGSEDGKGATTHGYVKLISGDAEKPTEPLESSDPSGETGNKGVLTIDNASPLLFGENNIKGGVMIFETKTDKPNVQVTDKRGEGQGWSLQVKTTDFVDQVDAKKILKGAELTLPVGTIVPAPGNISVAPTAATATLTSTNAKAQPIMTAAKNNGLGTWVDKFDSTQVKLMIPAGNLVGEYVSTLTWSLLDAPK